MRKIFIVTAVICLTFSIQPVALKNVDSAQINVSAPNDSTCDWPMFGRTPDGNRVVPDECGIDLRNLGIKWSFTTDHMVNEPVAKDNLVVFTCWDHKVYCLDFDSGKKVWEYEANDIIISTPTIYHEFVLFTSGGFETDEGKVYCLNIKDGSKLWELTTRFSIYSSPIVYNDKLYVACGEKTLYCLGIEKGNQIWKFETEYVNHYSPIFHSNKLYFGSSDFNFYCINANNGQLIWKHDLWDIKNVVHVQSSAVISNGNVIFKTSNGLMCLNEIDGSKKWHIETESESSIYENSPVVCGDRVLYIEMTDIEKGSGKLYSINISNGEKMVEIPISPKEIALKLSSPVLFKNKLVLPNNDGLSVYSTQTYKLLKTLKIGSIYDDSSSPIITNHCILLSFGKILFCINNDLSRNEPIKPKEIILSTYVNKINLCSTVQLGARVVDVYEDIIKDATLEWSVDPPEFGTIDSSGLFTPKKTGKVKITCKSGDLSESITIDVIEFLTVNSEGVRIDVVKPKQISSKTVVYTNNSDRKLTVDVVSNLGLVTVSPSSFVIEPGKSQEVSVSVQLASFEPVPDTEFFITATYDTCTKQLKGLLSSSLPFACLSASPDSLAFGMVERGFEKNMGLSVLSEVTAKISVSANEPWISVSNKEITLEAGIPITIYFKIRASSLPSASRLSGNVIIKSDVAFCDTLTIPVTVETEESITIKLKIDSKSATINNQKRDLDAPPKIMGGRTMVPLRFISEAFGCNIEWDAKEQRIGILRYDISVNLWIGKDYVEVNGQKLKIDSPPVIVAGRTMVPLRFIAEPFGAKVEWSAQTKEITIIWPKP